MCVLDNIYKDNFNVNIKGVNFNVQVKARTSIGWGSFSNVRTVRTLEDVPGNPENFSMIFQDETTI